MFINKFILETADFLGNSQLPLLCYKEVFNLIEKMGQKL